MVQIVICDPLHPVAIDLLNRSGFTIIDNSKDKGTLSHSLQTADGIIIRSATKITKEFLKLAPKLQIIGRAGVGLDNVDREACKKQNIKVVNSPEGPTQSVVELTLGLMIATARKLIFMDTGTKSGAWPKKDKGIELAGKTLGIVGSGAIGGLLAKYCITLGMNVIAYDIVEIDELKKLSRFKYEKLDTVFRNADFISMHVPLVPATKHMLDKSAFDKMKNGVIVINASRGGIIDEDALFQALESNKVSAAALDVYEQEPVDVSNPLMSHPFVIATPHIGAQTAEASENNATIVSKKIINHFISVSK